MENKKINISYERVGYIILAFIIFVFFQYGMNQWSASGHSLLDSWKAATQADWLLTITLFDGGIFAIICLSWMIYDLKNQSLNWVFKILVFLLALVFGAAGFLLYLVIRKPVTMFDKGKRTS